VGTGTRRGDGVIADVEMTRPSGEAAPLDNVAMIDATAAVDTTHASEATGAPEQSPTLTVRHLTRQIGERAVLDDVSLTVADGELLVLVGPSGCGKSTLLRSIAGVEPSTEGSLELDGVDISHLPPERRRIGLVFQDHALFSHRRVDQNIAFGLRSLPRADRAARVEEMLALVRLPHAGHRYPHELSGGEQQRVALARALAPDPAIVLLDEPFASLDPSLREEVRNDVVDALRARHAAAVLVTHERDEALGLGDRVAVMNDGRILQVGRPDEVYGHPADRFVAGFLGDASFLPEPDGVGVSVARPHDLLLTSGGPDIVTGRRYLGAAWRYEVTRGDGTRVRVDAGEGSRLKVGDPCTVSIVADRPLHRLGGS